MSMAARPSLLLLPSPPRPQTRSSLFAAYRPPIYAVLSRLQKSFQPSRLVIAVVSPPCTPSAGGRNGPGSSARAATVAAAANIPWTEVQSLLAGLYSVIAACAAELGVATDVGAAMPGSVDARVVLVTQPSLERSQPSSSRTVSAPPRPQITFGPSILVDFETFVAAYHPWDTMFLADGEAGHALSEAFLSLAERVAGQTILHSQLVTVGGGLSMHVPSSASAPDASNKMGVKEPSGRDPCRRYPTVCLGGTFDHLHLGHKLLLSAAAYLLEVPERKSDDDTASCTLIVGVTGDELLRNKKYAEYVQSWDRRAASVLDFLSTILELNAKGGWRRWTGGMDPADDVKMEKDDNGNTTEMLASFRRGTIVVQCVRIHDAFGPTITQENVDALVVSGETRAGGKAVNDRRAELGWHGLEIYEVDVLGALPDADGADSGDAEGKEGTGPAEHFSDKISSTEIRRLRQMAEKGQG